MLLALGGGGGGAEALFDVAAEGQERGATPNIFHAEFIWAPVPAARRVSCLLDNNLAHVKLKPPIPCGPL